MMSRRSAAVPALFLHGVAPPRRASGREHRVGVWRYVLGVDIATLLTAPLIYSVLFPFVLLDAWVTAYQAICFRAWGIRRVERRDYFAIDRHKLAYLNTFERVHCLYCSYANGLSAYVGEISARTEQYWCPIRHARRVRGAHARSRGFAGYGDGRAYRERLPSLRASLKR